ncbi:aspartate-semialdehyde dehydrogenase [Avrilella dinanensis]|uniref:Aspartate-semialdehyde dehydrogenase n=1 Tax=Avrilella dinanensis TaxID=2008672 RepID=A0A2M9R488_9FLAO|nr:aspartate-semialdehyde dehydrogenase [Avrilella dinanensis]PJR03690.1 aspartate-semialdehyde dehydrogenase [Avrilella dinanensis]
MKVAVVGATGMVGKVMLEVLAERNFPVTELLPVASEKSIGKTVEFRGKSYAVIGLEEAVEQQPDIALFSAGGGTSLKWAPKFSEKGSVVIDNSSAWRMHPEIKLIVPEINGNILTKEDKIIANPNCSTSQLVMVLQPLHDAYTIHRVVVSTYQSITGTGVKAVQQLENEMTGQSGEMAYHYPIFQNAIPHCDVFLENGYTREEMKLTNETKKILGDDNVLLTATAVRIPVVGGHSESVNISFEKDFDITDIKRMLSKTPGITLKDNPDTNTYPMPIYAQGKDDVFVGRIRRDETAKNSLNLWIVADNLRKGAATNTVQIAEYLIQHQLV